MGNSRLIESEFFGIIKSLIKDKSVVVAVETPLLGDGSVLDSMKLVELCLALEDKAQALGFEFDWTSDVAMSRSRSMFRSAGSLLSEFRSQMDAQK